MIIPLDFSFLKFLGEVDPSPFFVLSLVPYLAFLYWAQKTKAIPRISLWGFRLTLFFVFMTIVLAIFALQIYGDELTNVDALHGTAESFLTISDALVLFGFIQVLKNKEVKNS